MKTAVVGSYPKVAEDTYGTKLRGAIHRWQQQDISDDELEQVAQDVTRAVIAEQESAGVDVITDGQIRWEDLVTPLATQWSHTEITGLTRYFNNNTYYRKPVITGRPERKGNRLVEQFQSAKAMTQKATLKAVVPGPFTFVELSENRSAKDDVGFLSDVTQLIRQEIEALHAAGASIIQIDEPSLAFSAPDTDAFLAAWRLLTSNIGASCWLRTYFGAPQLPLEVLLEAQPAGIGLDFVEAPDLAARVTKVSWPADIGLSVGCINARNTKLERADDINRLLQQLSGHMAPEQLYLSPNCGFEFLPHDRVLHKLSLLVSTAQEFQKEGAACS